MNPSHLKSAAPELRRLTFAILLQTSLTSNSSITLHLPVMEIYGFIGNNSLELLFATQGMSILFLVKTLVLSKLYLKLII